MESYFSRFDAAVKFWGDLACFTRPEFKVERVSYPVMTPAAARGSLEAIFWKPEIRWEIREIWLLEPVKQIAIMRNELSDRQSVQAGSGESFYIEERRQQRTSLFIKNPAYLVLADIRLKESTQHHKQKYLEQFNRRLQRGKCHHQPYLGTRECSAYFAKVSDTEKPVTDNIAIGQMFFDTAYCRSMDRHEMTIIEHDNGQARVVSCYAQPLFFEAEVIQGILQVPWQKYAELYRLEGVHVQGISG